MKLSVTHQCGDCGFRGNLSAFETHVHAAIPSSPEAREYGTLRDRCIHTPRCRTLDQHDKLVGRGILATVPEAREGGREEEARMSEPTKPSNARYTIRMSPSEVIELGNRRYDEGVAAGRAEALGEVRERVEGLEFRIPDRPKSERRPYVKADVALAIESVRAAVLDAIDGPAYGRLYHSTAAFRAASLAALAVAQAPAPDIDEERLKQAHRNLFIETGRGLFPGYVEALAAEYRALGESQGEPTDG